MLGTESEMIRAPENTMQQAPRSQLISPTLLSCRSCQHCAQGHQGLTRLGVITASPATSPPPPHVSYLTSSRSPPSLPRSKTLVSTPLNYCHTLPANLPSIDYTTSLPYQPFYTFSQEILSSKAFNKDSVASLPPSPNAAA